MIYFGKPMNLNIQPPKKALNKAYLKEKVGRAEIELFKKNFSSMLSRIDEAESEEHGKNIVADFLKDTWYRALYEINTKDRKDLVIHTGKTAKDAVGVILEVKKPGNQQPFIDLVDEIMKAKQNNNSSEASALLNRLDVMIYKLYDLTDKDIMLVEGLEE